MQNCGHQPILVTDFASWDNCDIKIGSLANFVPKFDNNQKCWVGFNVNSLFEKVQWFEIENFDCLNCSIIWFDTKNVELK